MSNSIKVKFDSNGRHVAIFENDFSYLRGFAAEAQSRYAEATRFMHFLKAEFSGAQSDVFFMFGNDESLMRRFLPDGAAIEAVDLSLAR